MSKSSNFVIVKTAYFYGPEEKKSLVSIDESPYATQFMTRREAQAALDAYDAGRYYLSHNESGRPDFKIVQVSRLPKYLFLQV